MRMWFSIRLSNEDNFRPKKKRRPTYHNLTLELERERVHQRILRVSLGGKKSIAMQSYEVVTTLKIPMSALSRTARLYVNPI